jgi:glutamine cyclotransferase
MRTLVLLAALATCACGHASQEEVPEYGYEVVHTFPHDRAAFTEGLFYWNGLLYESTGLEGESYVRKVKLETGEVLQQYTLPADIFGEGIVNWKDKLVQLTYKTQLGFVYDLKTFAPKSQFHYPGEGWSLTTDGKVIYMDDGTSQIRIWDPETFQENGRITVTDDGVPVDQLNELEWVKGELYANIWRTSKIARIDPKTGHVVGWINLVGLLDLQDRIKDGPLATDVMNGIAYDAEHDRLFVSGKRWPKLFEIRLVKKESR